MDSLKYKKQIKRMYIHCIIYFIQNNPINEQHIEVGAYGVDVFSNVTVYAHIDSIFFEFPFPFDSSTRLLLVKLLYIPSLDFR